jgi:copper chaperone CopZ
MESITLTAPAISCSHCQRKVEDAVGALPGVEEVQVVVPTKQVTIRYDPVQLTRERIEIALVEAGYPAQDGAVAPARPRGKTLLNVRPAGAPHTR